jgi:hypothetical protein
MGEQTDARKERPSVGDSLAILFFLAAILMWIFVPTFWIKVGSTLAVAAGVAYLFCRSYWTHSWSKAKKRSFSVISATVTVIAGCLLLYLQWEQERHPEPNPPIPHVSSEDRSRESPHLSAQLTFTASANDGRMPRVILENVGKIKIDAIQCTIQTDQGSSFDGIPYANLLVPGAKAEMQLGYLFGKKMPLILSANVTYLGYTDETGIKYYSHFSFLIPEGQPYNQPIFPSSIQEGQGDGDIQNEVREGMATFANPSGTIFYGFPEINPDGSPNQIFQVVKNRMLLVNPLKRKAALVANYPSGQKVSEQPFAETPKGQHVIAVLWDDKKQFIQLYVDGVAGKTLSQKTPPRAQAPR